MKILQLGKFYPILGGIEKVMFDLTLEISKKGIHTDLLCTSKTPRIEDTLYIGQSKIFIASSIFEISSTVISLSMISMLRKICHNYDIIHIHHPDPMACIALFLSGYKGKVILHWHSEIVKHKLLQKSYSLLQNWLLNRVDAIITTSPISSQCESLKPHFHKCKIIPIGIDPLDTDRNEVLELYRKFDNKKIIFSLGRLVKYKGMKYLIDAAAYLPDNFVIVIGGQGPLYHKLRRRIINRKLYGKVFLTGYIPDNKRGAYYTASTLFCLPSIKKSEAFGIVQIEAMSCRRPVVATNIEGSGVSWVNHHGVSGLNVGVKSPENLAKAILTLTSSSDIYERYCEGAEKRFNEMFTKNKMIDKCMNLYLEIFNERVKE